LRRALHGCVPNRFRDRARPVTQDVLPVSVEEEVFDWLRALAEARASITATLHVTAAQPSAYLLDDELLDEAERDSLLGALDVLERLDAQLRLAVLA
jgi:hypothetical protein